jgi:DNA repair protein RadC
MSASNIDLFTIDANGSYALASSEQIIAVALRMLKKKVMRKGRICSPEEAQEYFNLRIGGLEHEVFVAVFLDMKGRLIEYAELFRGTINQTPVYPREIVKLCLSLNAASIIVAHNHPSGIATPSDEDVELTKVLKAALALIDVRLLDHIVVAFGSSESMMKLGLM